jgi:hypothetical protein
MIVVDVLRVGCAADRADTTLLGEKLVDDRLRDPVTAPQVVLPRAPVEALLRLLATGVGARLAVATATALSPRDSWSGLISSQSGQ